MLATYAGGGLSWQNQQRCFEEWRRIALEHTERPEEVRRTFDGMDLDVRRQVVSRLPIKELLRLAPRDPVARSALRKRLRRGLKEQLRRLLRVPKRGVVVEFGDAELGGVQSAEGLSGAEWWGRWTVGKRAIIELAEPVVRPVRLSLRMREAFGPNVGRPLVIRLEGGEYQHVLRAGEQVFTVKLRGAAHAPLRHIELGIPAPASPTALALGADDRLLGVAVCRLEVDTAP